jgi:hypothetical protein
MRKQGWNKVPGSGLSSASAADAAARERGANMTLSIVALQPIVALVAGVLILLFPRLLNMVVAIYLIAIGILGLMPH